MVLAIFLSASCANTGQRDSPSQNGFRTNAANMSDMTVWLDTTTGVGAIKTNDEKNTATTTRCEPLPATTTTTIYVDGPSSALEFSTLLEYKNKLITLSDKDSLYQALLNASEYGSYSCNESDFEMLLTDRYFLLPLLPAGSTLSNAKFFGNGTSEFTVKLSDGSLAFFVCLHNRQKPGELENAVRTTLVNSRGSTIVHDHAHDALSDAGYGDYTWKEDNYYCRMPYEGDNLAAYESFLKELSFEKVLLK